MNLAGQGPRSADSSNLLDQKAAGPVVALAPASAQAVSQVFCLPCKPFLSGPCWWMSRAPWNFLPATRPDGIDAAGSHNRQQTVSQHGCPRIVGVLDWLGGRSQDYLELEPIRKMDQVVNGVTQRERLVAGIAGLSERTGGATGLYDSTLAAYSPVQASYDSRAINSVILFTDGANHDPDIPSVSADALLARGK